MAALKSPLLFLRNKKKGNKKRQSEDCLIISSIIHFGFTGCISPVFILANTAGKNVTRMK